MRGRIAAVAGWAVFILCAAVVLSRAGTHWKVGHLGMPEPLLDRSGCYPDGTPADPLNRAAVASGRYQEAAWLLFGSLLAGLGWLAWQIADAGRKCDRGRPPTRASGAYKGTRPERPSELRGVTECE